MDRMNEIDIIRHESIRLAVEASAGQPPHRIMEFAKEIETFLRGNAARPEKVAGE